MPISYVKASWDYIEHNLLTIISDEFPNVFISPIYKKIRNEGVRINLLSNTNILTTQDFEQREYDLIIRYYIDNIDMSNMNSNEAVKNKVDRLKTLLLDNQVSSAGGPKPNLWDELTINSIEYNVNDDENEDNETLNITELQITIINTNNY